jgi:hypothetical protein
MKSVANAGNALGMLAIGLYTHYIQATIKLSISRTRLEKRFCRALEFTLLAYSYRIKRRAINQLASGPDLNKHQCLLIRCHDQIYFSKLAVEIAGNRAQTLGFQLACCLTLCKFT